MNTLGDDTRAMPEWPKHDAANDFADRRDMQPGNEERNRCQNPPDNNT
jgi:hypothetical protein